MIVNLNEIRSDSGYFRKALLDSIKVIVVIEFVVNFYAFSLWVELVLVPLIIILAAASVAASLEDEHKQVKRLLDSLLAIFSIALLVFTIREFFLDFQTLLNLDNLRDMLVPIYLTIGFLPYIYLVALYVEYEALFARIEIFNNDPDIGKQIKHKVLLRNKLNLRKLGTFSRKAKLLRADSSEEIPSLFERSNFREDN